MRDPSVPTRSKGIQTYGLSSQPMFLDGVRRTPSKNMGDVYAPQDTRWPELPAQPVPFLAENRGAHPPLHSNAQPLFGNPQSS